MWITDRSITLLSYPVAQSNRSKLDPYKMLSFRSERRNILSRRALASRTFAAALLSAIALAAPIHTAAAAPAKTSNSIVALVNDEPITGFELEQRSMMLSGGDVQKKAQEFFKASIKNPKTNERLKAILNDTIQSNEGKSRDQIIAIFERRKKQFAMDLQKQAVSRARASALPALKKKALDELIDEKLKLQEAKRLNISVGDDEINRVIGGIAQRNNMSTADFLKRLGPGTAAMKDRIRSSLAWADVVRRRYGAQVSIAQRDVDRLVSETQTGGQDQVELNLQRILIATPAKMEQYGVAQRMDEAEKMRSRFTDCKSTGKVAAGVAGAKFDEVGRRSPNAFPEPTRSLLLNAKDGEMLPPSMGTGGIELWVVCGRSVVKADEEKRNQAELQLRNKEFELLAQRHLKDLRQDAHIEYR